MGGLPRSLTQLPNLLPAADVARIVGAGLSPLKPMFHDATGFDRKANPGKVPFDQIVRRFIEADLADTTLCAGTLCCRFSLLPTALRRLLGPGFGDFAQTIRRLRLAVIHSATMMSEPEGPSLAAIGARWGMIIALSFRRAFTHEFGCAPSTLRQCIRSGNERPGFDAGTKFERWFQGWPASEATQFDTTVN